MSDEYNIGTIHKNQHQITDNDFFDIFIPTQFFIYTSKIFQRYKRTQTNTKGGI